MAKTKTIDDEIIVAALLENGTQRAAAAAIGISERTISDRINDGDFQVIYKAAKADLIRTAVFNINRQLSAAIDTVTAIMNDESNNAAVRLQAAQTILSNASKFAQRLELDEYKVEQQIRNNAYNARWGDL